MALLFKCQNSDGFPVSDRNGNPIQTTTQIDGSYSFSDIPVGDYTVVQTNLPGYQDTSDIQGDNDNRIAVTLTAGTPATNQNFVDDPTISGRVWNDYDDNGIEGGFEPGLPGVSVTLIGAGVDGNFGTADDPVDLTTTTDSDGRYQFDTFNYEEQYKVAFDLPTNLESEFTGFTDKDLDPQDKLDSDVDTGNLDGDNNPTTSITDSFIVPIGEAKGDIDAGLIDSAPTNSNTTGTSSPDTINGTPDDEILIGYKGQDTLTGGGGSDIFFMNVTREGFDLIADFVLNYVNIDFTQILKNEVNYSGSDPISDGYLVASQFGNRGTMIQVNFDLNDGINAKSVVFLAGVSNYQDFGLDNIVFDSNA